MSGCWHVASPGVVCGAEPAGEGGLCREHGCHRCGGVVLVDTEDSAEPLCFACAQEAD